jgi:hypothetical protein
MKTQAYTVVLLYPLELENPPKVRTYLAQVVAATTKSAIAKARAEIGLQSKIAGYKFIPVFLTEGRHFNLLTN